jgi:hypothetical protein
MDIPSVLLIFFILLVPATVILLPRWIRSRERQRILDTVMQAAEKGTPLPESVIQSLIHAAAGGSAPTLPDPSRDMRRGVFLAMIGLSIVFVGLAVLALFFEHGGAPVGILIAALGAVPICIGFGYMSVARMAERARKSVVE